MIQLQFQEREELKGLVRFRESEQKLGEQLTLCDTLDALEDLPQRYVVFGICEDIGVQANLGNPGAKNAWKHFLNSFVNIQVNDFNKPDQIIFLGKITVSPDFEITPETSREQLGDIVSRIDNKVAIVIQRIVASGKIPIVIGGGHNNAFGILKGVSTALKKPVNCFNIDAHTDLRVADYRHSGNGFTYALQNPDGPYLNKYAIFGLHKNYTPQYIFDFIKEHNHKTDDAILYTFLEDMFGIEDQIKAFDKSSDHVSNEAFGIELDCDSIAHFPSSAKSSTGFSLESVRIFISKLSSIKHSNYLHICEAAPSKNDKEQVGKALSYLVSDFIRNHRSE